MVIPFGKVADQSRAGGRRYGRKDADERRAERRARLEAAGIDLFAKQGFRQTPIEQLCAAANVSTRTFYEEFASRDALLAALHDDLNAAALEAVVLALSEVPAGAVAERAEAGCRAYFEVMTADPRLARVALIESVGVSSELEAHRQAALDRFADIIEREGKRLAGAGLLPDRPYDLVAIALVGAIKELVMSWAMRPRRMSVRRVTQEATRLVLVVLAAP